jgi:hypothetical protein
MTREQIYHRFYTAFRTWFEEEGEVDFWSESNAPENLATIAATLQMEHPPIAPEDMQFGHFYVVEVSFRETNPIHRAIAFEARGETISLIGGGYATPCVRWRELYFFSVVEEIESLKLTKENFRLPPKREGVGK